MSGALSSDTRTRLAKLCGLLGSDHAGERAAAALHATRLLRQVGLTWTDFVDGAGSAKDADLISQEWRDIARTCLRRDEALTPWEQHFCTTLLRRPCASAKQLKCLAGIADRLGISAV